MGISSFRSVTNLLDSPSRQDITSGVRTTLADEGDFAGFNFVQQAAVPKDTEEAYLRLRRTLSTLPKLPAANAQAQGSVGHDGEFVADSSAPVGASVEAVGALGREAAEGGGEQPLTPTLGGGQLSIDMGMQSIRVKRRGERRGF